MGGGGKFADRDQPLPRGDHRHWVPRGFDSQFDDGHRQEVLLAILIRDNLTLNVIMLLFPIDAIKQRQMGG
jgi:hypothetical protein